MWKSQSTMNFLAFILTIIHFIGLFLGECLIIFVCVCVCVFGIGVLCFVFHCWLPAVWNIKAGFNDTLINGTTIYSSTSATTSTTRSMTTTSYFTTDSSTTDLTTTDLTTTDVTTTDVTTTESITTDSVDLNETSIRVTASISYLFPCGSNNNNECSESYAFDAYSTFKVTLLVKIFNYDLLYQNDSALSMLLDDCTGESEDPSCITWNMKNHNSIVTLNEYLGDSVSFGLSNSIGLSDNGKYYSFETTLSFSNQRTSNGGYCYSNDSIPDWWFIPGEFYSFSVNFSDPDFGNVAGSDYTNDVYFNDLAKGGSCMLDNDTYSLLDEFVISCDNWTDSDADDSYLLYNGLLNG